MVRRMCVCVCVCVCVCGWCVVGVWLVLLMSRVDVIKVSRLCGIDEWKGWCLLDKGVGVVCV